MKRRIREWWRRLLGNDDESREIADAFRATVAAPPVPLAVSDVLAATERACLAARREARRTPPPIPRERALPSIPDLPEESRR
jgi:hypothetical protein